jgi:isoquinoline 1-oxidoreductase subunit alpha
MKFSLNVNSRAVEVDVDPDLPLLWSLRGHVELGEAAYGCADGLCDACTVRIDGTAIRSCITPVCTIGSARITTIESATLNREAERVPARTNVPPPQRGRSTR